MSCQNTDHKDDKGTCDQSMVIADVGAECKITDGSCDGCADVNVFLKDDRCLSGKNVAENTAADSSDHAEESTEERVLFKTCGQCLVDAGNREKTKADGIQHIHKIIVFFRAQMKIVIPVHLKDHEHSKADPTHNIGVGQVRE